MGARRGPYVRRLHSKAMRTKKGGKRGESATGVARVIAQSNTHTRVVHRREQSNPSRPFCYVSSRTGGLFGLSSSGSSLDTIGTGLDASIDAPCPSQILVPSQHSFTAPLFLPCSRFGSLSLLRTPFTLNEHTLLSRRLDVGQQIQIFIPGIKLWGYRLSETVRHPQTSAPAWPRASLALCAPLPGPPSTPSRMRRASLCGAQ